MKGIGLWDEEFKGERLWDEGSTFTKERLLLADFRKGIGLWETVNEK